MVCPFRSLQSTVKAIPLTSYKLPLILDSGISYKGYYYFTSPKKQKNKPIK